MASLDLLRRLVEPVLNRVKVLAQRSVVDSSDDSSKAMTLSLRVLSGDSLRDVESLGHYGLTSRPPSGGEAVVLCLGGMRDHPIAIAHEDRRDRPTALLLEGEAMLYSKGGARIHVKADGSVVIDAPAGVTVNGDLSVDGDVVATGDVEDAGGTVQDFRDAYNAHTHAETGTTTSTPTPTI